MSQTENIMDTPLIRKLSRDRAPLRGAAGFAERPRGADQPAKVIAASKEAGQLEPVVARYREYQAGAQAGRRAARAWPRTRPTRRWPSSPPPSCPRREAKADALLEALKDEFVAAEDNAVDSFFLEIRAGTGGEEAAPVRPRPVRDVPQLLRDASGWRFDVSDFSASERGGFKEVIVNVKGNGAYRHLRFEGGGHRVQRVPETEAQGRIHTSAATVAVLPEMPDVKIDINPKDVEEFGCRGGGPGGQNVNKVETGWLHPATSPPASSSR